MASQIGKTRIYSSLDEATDTRLVTCVKCKVKAVPRGISDTGKTVTGEVHCPNCGHIHGRDNH